ncbi:MAG: NAD(P)H-dependent oxidoreductase [Dermabacter sp.]|nr:NAD(P)H-dependent oxidoreductase [Dermabacter sp.]
MTDIRVAVVQAGLSTPSTTSRLADTLQGALVHALEQAGHAAHVQRINLRDIAVGVTEATLSGIMPEAVEEALAHVQAAHILVAVTPTFNASYSGIFKSFFDLVEPRSLVGTTAILGATGGTSRHSLVIDMSMRPLFSYLRAMPVPTSIFASADDFAGTSSISARAAAIASEAVALATHASTASTGTSPAGQASGSGAAHGAGGSDGADGSDGVSPALLEEDPVLQSSVGEFVPFSRIARDLHK